MGFEWDRAKDAANRRKHGIGFCEAAEIFRGVVVVAEDTRRDYGSSASLRLVKAFRDMGDDEVERRAAPRPIRTQARFRPASGTR
jgi:hypothetical protein